MKRTASTPVTPRVKTVPKPEHPKVPKSAAPKVPKEPKVPSVPDPPGTIFANVSARDACFNELKLCCDSYDRTYTQLVADSKRVEAEARAVLVRVATFDVYKKRLLEALDEIADRHTNNKRLRGEERE